MDMRNDTSNPDQPNTAVSNAGSSDTAAPNADPQDGSPAADGAGRAYDRFVAGQQSLSDQLSDKDGPPEVAVEARPSRKAAWLAMGAVVVALGLLWLAPGVDDHANEAPTPEEIAAAGGDPDAATDAAAPGKTAALQFTMKDMNGVDVKLASFRGKVILMNFWATWCGPCRAEIPALIELQKQYGDDLVVLGVSVDDPLDKLKPYATEMHMNYPVLMGKDREDVQEAYGPLWGIPVSVFIDREGKIWKRHSGIASKEQFEKEIKALL